MLCYVMLCYLLRCLYGWDNLFAPWIKKLISVMNVDFSGWTVLLSQAVESAAVIISSN